MEQYVEMKDRCLHVIDEISLKCKKCGSPFDLAKKDPRPFQAVKNEHREAREQRYDMNENLKEDAQVDEDYKNVRRKPSI